MLSGPRKRRFNRGSFPFSLGSCFLLVLVATLITGPENQSISIWIANGLLLSYLLLTRRRRWMWYLSVGVAAQFAAELLLSSRNIPIQLSLAVLNVSEVGLAACLLRCRQKVEIPAFTNPRYLLRFLGYAVVVAPAVVGLVFATIANMWVGLPFRRIFQEWFFTDALGMAVTTPAFVVILRMQRNKTEELRSQVYFPLVLVIVTPLLLMQAEVPAMAVILPLLIVIQLRMGLGWASISTLYVAGVGGLMAGRAGALVNMASPGGSISEGFRLHLYIASAMLTLYLISAVMESRRAAECQLREIAYLHRLVTENSRDIIIIADFEGHRSYVSAAGTNWGGWSKEELLGMKSLQLLHPEDQPKAMEFVRQMKAGSDGAILEARAHNAWGRYVWIEASLRTIRDTVTGKPTGILNMVRDISERKKAEEELKEAYRKVEELAILDPLTGLANRRRFDAYLLTEWRRAMREKQPLSMILVDVDLFKPYNDTYGHVQGDTCLKQIAELLAGVVERPGDLVARYGGEEFAVVLANTEYQGALLVAEQMAEAVRGARMEHKGSPYQFVTISAGCGTTMPNASHGTSHLVELADISLYVAKRSGRNRVVGDLSLTNN